MTGFAAPNLAAKAGPPQASPASDPSAGDATPSRCPHCGAVPPTWNPEAVLEACRAWVREHGRTPTMKEWRHASPGHPEATTVPRLFGSWNTMIRAAGFTPRRSGAQRQRVFTREAVEQAIFEFVFAHGRLPRRKEWCQATDSRPGATTIIEMYGSWNAAIVAAGYEPTMKKKPLESYRRQAGAALRTRDERGRMVAA